MRVIRYLCFTALAGLAACHLGDTLPTNRLAGLFYVVPIPDTGGTYVIAPYGSFFNQVNIQIPDSRTAFDSCHYFPVILDTSFTNNIPSFVQFVAAGSPVTVTTGNASGTMTPDSTSLAPKVYYHLAGAPLPFTPGNSVTFNVPGATGGFPSSSITATTVAPYTLGPIDTMPADSLTLTWSNGAGGGTAINIQLQFDSAGGGVPDREIECSSPDDGQLVVPESLAVKWRNAAPGSRIVTSYKWVTSNSGGLTSGLVVNSEFRVVKRTFP